MKAMIAMSGGVDSSVAAHLMQQAGYECLGCTMELFENADKSAWEDAAAVAARFGMDFHLLSLMDAFKGRVMDEFAACYRRGETPNPCVVCNKRMKFGLLMEEARRLGCDKLVTGHYARVLFDGKKYRLFTAANPEKDQSYVLYTLSQEQLAQVAFPLGELSKEEVRQIAAELDLPVAKKAESQDICFVPEGDYAAVIEACDGLPSRPGDFVDEEGRVLGRHRGIIHYTIGQRKGLGLSLPAPLFVIRIDAEKNEVVLGPSEKLFKTEVLVKDFHWISGDTPAGPVRGQAKLRYRQKAAPVTALPREDGSVLLQFDDLQRAPTPGQSAVLYDGEEVLGGGIIVS